MAPPATTPRLQHLVPRDVAHDVVWCVANRAQELINAVCDPEYGTPDWRWSCERGELHATVVALVAWAQKGGSDPDAAHKQAVVICDALYNVADYADGPMRSTPPAYAKDEIAVALRAASARHRLLHGEPIPTSELAALAGVSHRRINQLADGADVLRRPDSEISPYDSHELLASFLAPSDVALRKAAASDIASGLARWICADGTQRIAYRRCSSVAGLALGRALGAGFVEELPR